MFNLSWLFNPEQNFESYKLWQDKQPQTHFIASSFQPYIFPKPGYKDLHLKYTFGDFENLIYYPETTNDLAYFTLLVNTYDKCKGYLRSIKGDHEGITLLRKVVLIDCVDELYQFDFNKFVYPYQYIHAHTMAYFSLSTLILLFVSNYMHFKSYRSDHFPYINVSLCKNAYNNKIYGDINISKITKSITIPIKQKEVKEKVCHSWPSVSAVVTKCSHCSRLCDNYWGNHQCCLDCHLYKVCSVCGGQNFTIGKDQYPRCIIHQNL